MLYGEYDLHVMANNLIFLFSRHVNSDAVRPGTMSLLSYKHSFLSVVVVAFSVCLLLISECKGIVILDIKQFLATN